MIVEGMGGVGDAPFHARIAAMSARGRIVVLGEIVERGGKYIPYVHYSNSCTAHDPAVVSAGLSSLKQIRS